MFFQTLSLIKHFIPGDSMFNKIFLLTDDQIKDIFDNFRNLGICSAIFAAADWELEHIIPMESLTSMFNTFVFVFLIVTGLWLLFVTQLQAFRKLRSNGFVGIKLALVSYTYSLLAASLIASIFLH